MYNKFFGINDAPFSIAPNPRYLYMSQQHHEALAHLLYGIKSDGFITLTGEVGTGKTTVCRCFLEQIPDSTNVAFILNPKLTVIELLATICDELHISYRTDHESVENNRGATDHNDAKDYAIANQYINTKLYVDAINDYLLLTHAQGRKTLLIIDEAQNLSIDVLEQIRLLTNLETDHRKLLQIILIGQPELRDLFAKPELRQLAQRITARYHLEQLTVEETIAYVKHRLAVAGTSQAIFSPPVIHLLHRISGGIPRIINVICDRALLGAYVQSRKTVDKKTLKKAAKEVLGEVSGSPIAMGWLAGKGQLRLSYKPIIGVVVAAFIMVSVKELIESAWITTVPKGSIEATVSSKFSPMEFKSESPGGSYAAMDALLEKEFSLLDEQLQEDQLSTSSTFTTAVLEGITQIKSDTDNLLKSKPGLEYPNNIIRGVSQELRLDSDKLSRSMYDSYSVIFDRWNIKYEANKDGADPCQFAKRNGLGCLQKAGDLGALQALDRPAVLKFYQQDGQHFYLPLVRLEEGTATVGVAGEFREVQADILSQQWRGEYTIVWQLPPKYNGAIVLGTIGPEVKWLSKKLALVQENKTLEIGDSYYDEVMEEKIKLFQRAEGIVPDGVVGAKTYIKLNSASGEKVPQLAQRSERKFGTSSMSVDKLQLNHAHLNEKQLNEKQLIDSQIDNASRLNEIPMVDDASMLDKSSIFMESR